MIQEYNKKNSSQIQNRIKENVMALARFLENNISSCKKVREMFHRIRAWSLGFKFKDVFYKEEELKLPSVYLKLH